MCVCIDLQLPIQSAVWLFTTQHQSLSGEVSGQLDDATNSAGLVCAVVTQCRDLP